MSQKSSVASMVLGIISCTCCLEGFFTAWGISLIGIICGIIAIKLSTRAVSEVGVNSKNKAGMVCGVIGLIVSIISFIVGIILWAVCICTGKVITFACNFLWS